MKHPIFQAAKPLFRAARRDEKARLILSDWLKEQIPGCDHTLFIWVLQRSKHIDPPPPNLKTSILEFGIYYILYDPIYANPRGDFNYQSWWFYRGPEGTYWFHRPTWAEYNEVGLIRGLPRHWAEGSDYWYVQQIKRSHHVLSPFDLLGVNK